MVLHGVVWYGIVNTNNTNHDINNRRQCHRTALASPRDGRGRDPRNSSVDWYSGRAQNCPQQTLPQSHHPYEVLCICMSLFLSLSLYIYIYTYVYVYIYIHTYINTIFSYIIILFVTSRQDLGRDVQ